MNEYVELRDGAYYIPGTRISLDSIAYTFREGLSPESIREDFVGLTLANVYGAIAYYLDHRSDVDAYLRRRKEQWAELDRQAIPLEPDLKARLERARNGTLLPR